MTPEQQQKMQVRLTSLQNSITINQKAITGSNETLPTEKIIQDAQSIYEYLTKDETATPILKTLVN